MRVVCSVLQRERWMAKAPEPQAIQKLLHSRTTKLPDKSASSTSEAAQSVSSKTGNVSAKATNKSKAESSTSRNGKRSGKNAEKELSRYWEERSKKPQERQRKELITGILPNNYQPEPVVKKIAFGGINLLLFYITYFV